MWPCLCLCYLLYCKSVSIELDFRYSNIYCSFSFSQKIELLYISTLRYIQNVPSDWIFTSLTLLLMLCFDFWTTFSHLHVLGSCPAVLKEPCTWGFCIWRVHNSLWVFYLAPYYLVFKDHAMLDINAVKNHYIFVAFNIFYF